MDKLRVITRAIILDDESILLARNRDADFWYPPGGGWEVESESIKQSVEREVREETGYIIDVSSLLWAREFREPEKNKISLETFWKATISTDNAQTKAGLNSHRDLDSAGAVEECRWFPLDSLSEVKVLPKFLKDHLGTDSLTANAFIDE
ncbi:NUDIX domain-containing protein [Microbacteriaceae bacterium]|nr:NUDIX domain-containing protein [Candidatus Saccharibacteria bacterium]